MWILSTTCRCGEWSARAAEARQLAGTTPEAGADMLLRLLIGDWQIRRVIGAMEAPDATEVSAWARDAAAAFRKLCGVANDSLTI